MSDRPLVSIVLPTRNGGHLLRRSIQSCLSQTFSDLELIVVDDASDEPVDVALRDLVADPRVRIIRNDTNLGLPASLNRGFEQARGELFTWTSDDNEYAHHAIERMADELRLNEADVVYAGQNVEFEDGRIEKPPVRSIEWLAVENVVQACFLYRRDVVEAVGAYDESLECAEDYDFWLRARVGGFRFRAINDVLYTYRRHARSLTDSRARDVLSTTIASLARHLPRLPETSRGFRGRGHRQIAELALELGDLAVFRRHYLKAALQSPLAIVRRQASGRFPGLNLVTFFFGLSLTERVRAAYHRIMGRHATSSGVHEVVIRPRRGWSLVDLGEIWRYRELLWVLALRDIRVRYKQSVIGIAWALIQPLLTMVVFTSLFALMGRYPTTGDAPYAVALYTAMLPWQLFANSLAQSGESLITDRQLITKVYFPRVVIPMSPIVGALVDFAIAFGLLIVMMLGARWLGYDIFPSLAVLAVPFFVLLAAVASLALGLWLAALNALYRDFRYLIPFFLQLGLIASPVLYDYRFLAEKVESNGWSQLWLHLYSLNPMVGVLEGFRWALLGSAAPPALATAISGGATLVLLLGGLVYFRRMERMFADRV